MGVYGYPKDQALKVAVDVISSFLLENDMLVYIVIFDRAAYMISEKLFSDIQTYIDDNYVSLHTDPQYERIRAAQSSQALSRNGVWGDADDVSSGRIPNQTVKMGEKESK